MGRQIDYEAARNILKEEFEAAEREAGENTPPSVPAAIVDSTERLFSSSTQAFREALIGCCLARIIDEEIDIRLIYMNQGEKAFNGRTLDESVVNPFLRDRMVPCSRGPYLSALRRNVRLHEETGRGLRDKEAFRSLLVFVGELEIADTATAREYLRHLLREFVRLREAANIQLSHIARLSLEQYRTLIAGMLGMQRGAKWDDEWFSHDNMATHGFLYLIRLLGVELLRVTRRGGTGHFFIDWRMYPNMYGALESSGWLIKNLVVWDKGHFGMGSTYRNQHELIIYGEKEGATNFKDKGVGNVITASRSTGSLHPTEKPLGLLSKIIKIVTNSGDLVLDPFMGSGTTLRAAKDLGRQAIGIEIEERYCEIAARRLAQEVLPLV